MGVADNKTYRDQYHFTDDKKIVGSEYPSINDEDKINQTIKENPYRSNVEIEGGEIVMEPDLTALFKASGKRHSKGGMDVYLKPDSFIFSDFKDLALTESDHKLFELKKGGNFSPQNNTPAKVLKRNIPVKHYNTMVNNLQDINKDDLAKKSSALMLEKYIKTLGNIAYIQEEKKQFPDGIPPFSQGTAPVYNTEVKDNVMESKQYRKYGGNVYREAGLVSDTERCPCGGVYPKCNPCTPEQLQQFLQKAPKGTLDQATGMSKIGSIDNTDLYHTGTDPYSIKSKQPKLTPSQQIQANLQWRKFLANETPEHKRQRQAKQMVDGTDKLLAIPNAPVGSRLDNPFGQGDPGTNGQQIDTITPNSVPEGSQQSKQANWQFTPWQKISQAYNWGQYANVKRYMPYRSRYNATYAEPSLLNPEQAVGDTKAVANQQIQALSTLSPIARNAQAAATYGQVLNQVPGIRSQYDNQNAQINNQFRQYNNQVRNNESMVNMGNDQQYYQQAVTARTNFDNMRTFTANNAMNNTLRDVESNQKLAYNLLTQRPLTGGKNPYDYNWRTGDFVRNPMDIRDVQGNPTSDMYSEIFDQLKNANDPIALQKLAIMEKLLRQKNILPYLQQQQAPNLVQKKGGRVRNPYK